MRSCDVIQMDFPEGETNRTLGVVASIKMVVSKSGTFKSSIKNSFLMIVNDDTYINIPNLLDKLQVIKPLRLHCKV